MKVANPSSQDRTPRGAIVLAVPPAAAPYRASGLVHCQLPAIDRFGIFLMRQMPRERRRRGKLSTHGGGEKGRSDMMQARRPIAIPVLLSCT
jgi:hypothetical protein